MNSPIQALAQALLEIELNQLSKTAGHWSLELYLSELKNPDSKIFFWPQQENFKGFALYRVIPEKEVWVMNWAIRNKGQGEGQRLFAAFCDFCRKESYQKMGLEVRVTNAAALKIYKKCGLDLVGRRQNYYSNGEEALVYTGLLK